MTFQDVACPDCPMLCDDLVVTVAEGAWASSSCPCDAASAMGSPPSPPVDWDEAVASIAEALGRSRSPLITGLGKATVQDAREAIALAQRLGGVIDPWPRGDSDAVEAARRVGDVTATWGEVKDRADVIVLWRPESLGLPPRFVSRFLEAPGRFVPGPRAFVVFGEGGLPIDDDAATVQALRWAIKGARVEGPLGDVAERLKGAKYGAWLAPPGGGPAFVEATRRLVRDLNASNRRFVRVPWGPSGTASAVLTWQTGFPGAVSFRSGAPEHDRRAFRADRLVHGGADVVLWVAPSAPPIGPGPHLTIGPGTARPGLEAGGSVLRADGTMVPLRPLFSDDRPTTAEVLRMVREALGR